MGKAKPQLNDIDAARTATRELHEAIQQARDLLREMNTAGEVAQRNIDSLSARLVKELKEQGRKILMEVIQKESRVASGAIKKTVQHHENEVIRNTALIHEFHERIMGRVTVLAQAYGPKDFLERFQKIDQTLSPYLQEALELHRKVIAEGRSADV